MIKLDRKTIAESLADMLPYDQRYYSGTKAYQALVDALWNYLHSDIDSREEKKMLLEHAKEIFEDMCEHIPEPLHRELTWQEKVDRLAQ